MGTVLQDPDGQFIGLTVGEDIAFSLENSCMPQDEMHQITRKVAELVKINNHLDYAPHELSGGQKQRVSLAGVMVDQVKILLFDEPLANLDPATGKQTIELIDEIQKETDTTVVIIEHRLEDVLWRDVDRIILVSEGRILADLHSDELLATDLLAENGIPGATVSDCDALCRNHVDTGEKTIPCRQGCTAGRRCKTVKAVVPVAYGRKAGVGERASFGSEKPEFWIHKRTADASGCKPDDPKRRDGQHRRKERAGKSTFSKLVCGFEDPDQGEIRFAGKDLLTENIRHRAKHIGYVMQNPNQMISKTMIFDEVALSLRNTGMDEAAIRERVEETLKICGLYPFRNWPISALSFGQKKRVTIASVLVQNPELIILDEPTAGQDFHHYTEIMEFLRKLNEEGVTVVMITHDMHLMLEYTPRALVFADGRLIADDSAAAVLCNRELVERAALKETSLFTLANRAGITPPEAFVECFIEEDREVRSHGR